MFSFLSSWQDKVNTEVVGNVAGFGRSIVGNVLNFIRIAGTGIALIMLAYMSISYFSTDGSSLPFRIEKKADIKGKQLLMFAIGTAVFIGASNIMYFFADFIADIFGAL